MPRLIGKANTDMLQITTIVTGGVEEVGEIYVVVITDVQVTGMGTNFMYACTYVCISNS